jgi:putative ABC transport system substrate-binding protein
VPQLARELVAGGAELLIVQGAAIPDVLKLNLPLPIVFVTSGDPIAAGFAKSLTEPIGNCTGVTFMGFELLGKRLEFLKEVLPTAAHVTVLGNPLHPGSDIERASSEAAGGRLGISIDFIATPNQEVLATARATLARTRPDAISLLPDGFALAHRKPIMAIADELRIPSFRDGRLLPKPARFAPMGRACQRSIAGSPTTSRLTERSQPTCR